MLILIPLLCKYEAGVRFPAKCPVSQCGWHSAPLCPLSPKLASNCCPAMSHPPPPPPPPTLSMCFCTLCMLHRHVVLQCAARTWLSAPRVTLNNCLMVTFSFLHGTPNNLESVVLQKGFYELKISFSQFEINIETFFENYWVKEPSTLHFYCHKRSVRESWHRRCF